MRFQYRQVGFTLVELVMVIMLLGIISATVIPKFFDKNAFAEKALFDDTLNAVRYAQKLAVATGCQVQVAISSNSYSLNRKGSSSSTSCPSVPSYSLPVTHPGSGSSGYSGNESDVTLTSSAPAFVFTPLGAASTDLTLTVNGSRTISVVAETGFVYDSTP